MYNINWNILFTTSSGKKYQLNLLSELEINKSVDLLSDTATISLPASVMNKTLVIEDKIKKGDGISISLGYNGNLKEEFTGYINQIHPSDGSLTIDCQDELFILKKPVINKELKKVSVKQIVNYVLEHIPCALKLNCTLDIMYDKFVVHQATGYEILKKLQEEAKANIFIKDNSLHIHPPYIEKGGEVQYDFYRNIEKTNLTYKRKEGDNVQINVTTQTEDGKIHTSSAGISGGEQHNLTVSSISKNGIESIANNELDKHLFDGYEGSFTTWLVPHVSPTYTATIMDKNYPYKNGKYYVISVKTSISPSGGERVITLGKKL